MRSQHKDWFIASNAEVSVALGTSTTLHADQIEDGLWFERHLCAVLADLLGGRSPAEYSSLAEGLENIPLQLMAFGQFDAARLWMEVAVIPAMEIVEARAELPKTPTHTGKSVRASQPVLAHEHNLTDYAGLSFVNLVLGLRAYADEITKGFPTWISSQAAGHRKRRVGPKTTVLLQKVRDGLAFEQAAEGRRVTSDANIHQLIARDLASELMDETAWLVDEIEEDLAPWTTQLCTQPSLPAAAAASRLDEALNKATDVMLPALERFFEASESVHRDVDDAWPKLEAEALRQRLGKMQRDLRLPIARLASNADSRVDQSRPDVFGWAFNRAHEDLLADLLDRTWQGDPSERLQQLITATDRAMNRLTTTVRRAHPQIANAYAFEPLLLLLQVSGIAYVLDRYDGRVGLFAPFGDTWQDLLRRDPQRTLDTTLAALGSDDALFGMSAGKLTRSARMQHAIGTFEQFNVERLNRHWMASGLHDPVSSLGPTAEAIAVHLSISGGFEDVIVADWLIPNAAALGATVRPLLIASPRLQDFISELEDLRTANQDGPTSGDAGTVLSTGTQPEDES